MKKYHIDLEFEGERLVDNVEVLQEITKISVMVYSPKLGANIIIKKKELKER
jgi:hypothetical protein